MYDEHTKIPTTQDVWTAIHRGHRDLCLFGSYSAPAGEHGGDTAKMFSSYGIDGADMPLICVETTWDIDREKPSERMNEKTIYSLYVVMNQEEDS